MDYSRSRNFGLRVHYCVGWAALLTCIIVIPAPGVAGDVGHGQYLANRDTIALGAGDAMHHNRAIHTIDPWPRYSKDDKLKFDGQRMWLGITRYKANDSIEPEGMETQSVSKSRLGGGGKK